MMRAFKSGDNVIINTEKIKGLYGVVLGVEMVYRVKVKTGIRLFKRRNLKKVEEQK